MIDLRNYYPVNIDNVKTLGISTTAGKQLREIFLMIQNLVVYQIKKTGKLFYLPTIIISKIQELSDIDIELTPIYKNGKTDIYLFLETAKILNAIQFPFSIELRNIESAKPVFIIQYRKWGRTINNQNYDTKGFDSKIKILQNNHKSSQGFWESIRQTSTASKYYIHKSFVAKNLIQPQGSNAPDNIVTNIESFFKNPFGSLKKPLLYAGGAFLIYTVVKEAAKKHL